MATDTLIKLLIYLFIMAVLAVGLAAVWVRDVRKAKDKEKT